MPQCRFCDHRNSPGRQSCEKCGAELPVDPDETAPMPALSAGGNFSPFETEILTLVGRQGKIAAIKRYREASGLGLKESKDIVDALAARAGVKAASGVGCAGSVLLVLGVALASLLAAGQLTADDHWPDPVAHHVIPYHTSGLSHGPLAGQPTANGFRVWVRTNEPGSFQVLYSPHLPLLVGETPAVAGSTTAEHDNTGFVTITGLTPNTRYYYGVATKSGLVDTRMEFDDAWPSVRTLPDATSYPDPLNNPDGRFNLAFSIGCCMRQLAPPELESRGVYGSPPSFLMLDKHHRNDVNFHIVNGDFIYEETFNGTRAGIEENYKLYLSRGRSLANYLRRVPFLAMYNDHEANSNLDGDGEIGLGDGQHLKRDPAVDVWQDYVGWTNDSSLRKAPIRFGHAQLTAGSDVLTDESADFTTLKPDQVSTIHIGPYLQGDGQSKAARGGPNIGVYGLVKVLDAHRLQVTPTFKTDASAPVPYSIGTHHFFDRQIGNCHFFFLDTRGERSKFLGEKHAHDPDRFVLGETQRRWLLEGAARSTADFLIVISPDPWTIYHSGYHIKPEQGTGSKGDDFCAYVHERELLVNALDQIQKPVLIFTGDVHNSFSIQVTDNVWEFLVGPMNSEGHPIGTAGLPPFGGWFDSEGRTVKVKWVAGFPDNVHYSRLRNTYYAVVQINNLMRTARPEGVGYQFIPYAEPQAVVQFHDGYTGKLLYAEGISTLDSKSERVVAPKISRWPH